jgi:hypothetical protein
VTVISFQVDDAIDAIGTAKDTVAKDIAAFNKVSIDVLHLL